MNTILLTGGSGQIGWELARALLPLGKLVVPAHAECDLAQPQTLASLVDQIKPDVIVNAAAYTLVDQAEEEPALAMTINAEAPAILAQCARKSGALLIHYSTDYVFDGCKREPYQEADPPNPLNSYGRSKLAGENAILDSGADYLILRTSWVYGARGKNFLLTMLRLASEREQLQIVADQIGAPTWARLIAETTAQVLRQDLAQRATSNFASGLFHLTAAGSTSWHGFAGAILEMARQAGAIFKCKEVVPIPTSAYPLPAQRPVNSRLDGDKLARRYGLLLPDWETCTRLCIAEVKEKGLLEAS